MGQALGGDSLSPSVSTEGRFVAFHSSVTNLVPGDTNGTTDVFVHDRKTSITTRASVGPAGAEATGPSANASLSADGRYVAFESTAPTSSRTTRTGSPTCSCATARPGSRRG